MTLSPQQNGEQSAYPASLDDSQYYGLTKREHMATTLGAGMLANSEYYFPKADDMPKQACAAADALLAELAKPQDKNEGEGDAGQHSGRGLH